ncbi:MAG: hypothetical protein PHX78_04055 [bacterium]|nr:hypothetical protein [bacterium]
MKLKIHLLFCILIFMFCIFYYEAYAFAPGFPKLIWEKEYSFKIDEITIAEESGDVLISDKMSGQLVLIDNQGYERLHLGPKINAGIMNINISADGSKIMYCDSFDDLSPNILDSPVSELHFIPREGNEYWKKSARGIPILSPDATWYILSDFEEDGTTRAYNSNGDLLWEKSIPDGMVFSINSNYFVGGVNIGEWMSSNNKDITIHTYNRQGELRWEGKFKSYWFGQSGIVEVTKGGYLVWNFKDSHRIYDCLGNVVTEIPEIVKKAFISPDGNAVLFQYDSSFQVLNLPDKNLKIERELSLVNVKLSNGGNYLVGTQNMPENIVVFDARNNSVWKKYIEGDLDSYKFIHLTNNGKYLLILKRGGQHLYYYQIW